MYLNCVCTILIESGHSYLHWLVCAGDGGTSEGFKHTVEQLRKAVRQINSMMVSQVCRITVPVMVLHAWGSLVVMNAQDVRALLGIRRLTNASLLTCCTHYTPALQRMNRDDRFANLGLRDDTDMRGSGAKLQPYDNVAVVFRSNAPRGAATIEYGKQAPASHIAPCIVIPNTHLHHCKLYATPTMLCRMQVDSSRMRAPPCFTCVVFNVPRFR